MWHAERWWIGDAWKTTFSFRKATKPFTIPVAGDDISSAPEMRENGEFIVHVSIYDRLRCISH